MILPDAILATLAKIGFRTCFGLPGEPVVPIWNAFERQNQIKLVMVRQENNMVWMTDASMKLDKLSFALSDYLNRSKWPSHATAIGTSIMHYSFQEIN